MLSGLWLIYQVQCALCSVVSGSPPYLWSQIIYQFNIFTLNNPKLVFACWQIFNCLRSEYKINFSEPNQLSSSQKIIFPGQSSASDFKLSFRDYPRWRESCNIWFRSLEQRQTIKELGKFHISDYSVFNIYSGTILGLYNTIIGI